jgi:hypothetical protein
MIGNFCSLLFVSQKKAMSKYLIGAVIFSMVIGISSCSKDDNGGGTTTVDCSTVTNKAFTADVNPIIQSTCAVAGCHATGSSNGPGALTGYTQIFNARSTIRTAVVTGRMPQGGSLSTAQKNSIICWIDNGAPNN